MNSVLGGMDDFKFGKNLSLLNGAGSTSIKLAGSRNPAVLLALATPEGVFPPADIELADVALEAGTAKPIEFARGADKVSFTAQASAFAGFGIYHSGPALLAKLGQHVAVGEDADDFSLSPIEFDDGETSLLSVIRWGFGAGGG